MTRSFGAALIIALASSLLLAMACGSSPSAAVSGSGTTQSAPPDYRYGGRLESGQDAVNAVLAMLDSEAKSDGARRYRAEYLMVARDRVFAAGGDTQSWYVTFSMGRKADADQGEKPYWENAAWIVLSDGKVMPSTRHGGNATRILADLRASGS